MVRMAPILNAVYVDEDRTCYNVATYPPSTIYFSISLSLNAGICDFEGYLLCLCVDVDDASGWQSAPAVANVRC